MQQPSSKIISNASGKEFELVVNSVKAQIDRLTHTGGQETEVVSGHKCQLIYQTDDGIKISAKGFAATPDDATRDAILQLEREGYSR